MLEITKERNQGRSRASLLQSIRIFSKPSMRELCLQMGGQGPPQQPPAFLKSCQLASKHTRLFDAFDASVVFANPGRGGVQGPPTNPPAPRLMLSRARCFSILAKPVMRALCLRMGGGGGAGARPPPTPRSFYIVLACFRVYAFSKLLMPRCQH